MEDNANQYNRESLGANASSTEAVFKQFLDELPKAGSGIPETHIGYFGNWIFDTANSGYPVPLAGCLPEGSGQTALVKFADGQ